MSFIFPSHGTFTNPCPDTNIPKTSKRCSGKWWGPVGPRADRRVQQDAGGGEEDVGRRPPKFTGRDRPGGPGGVDRPGEKWWFFGDHHGLGKKKKNFFNILKPPSNWDIIGLTKNNRILKLWYRCVRKTDHLILLGFMISHLRISLHKLTPWKTSRTCY